MCNAGAATFNSTSASSFELVPATYDFTVYPGGTTTLPVYVQPINSAVGTVSLGGISLPQGVTIAPTTAQIGSTA